MKPSELKSKIVNESPAFLREDYPDEAAAKARFSALCDRFIERFGDEGDVSLFSVGGRTEIAGNHTDHNGGLVLAGAIDRDIVVLARKSEKNEIHLYSAGFPENNVYLDDVSDPEAFRQVSSSALIAGMVQAFRNEGLPTGGFDAVTTSDVPKGSGLSSSAAFEVAVGTVLNHFYCDGSVSPITLAKMAQYSENVYFGKPCGLLDQTACAVGGLVYLGFADAKNPKVEKLEWPFADSGYCIAIVNTASSHAGLSDEYAAIPDEMKKVASMFGKERMVGISEKELMLSVSYIRRAYGDRAFLRALHFVRENKRVEAIRTALFKKDAGAFFRLVSESGRSSFEYLQNVYVPKAPDKQSISLALALADGYMRTRSGAYRIHGGGFAGTIQVFLKKEDFAGLRSVMDAVFGQGATGKVFIRKDGCKRIAL